MTNKATLANFLVENPKTWLSTEQINSVGGTRRLRELRSEGWSIKTKREGREHSYQLTRVPNKAVRAQFAN